MSEMNKKLHRLANRKGQVGLIIILAVAFGLIFYAASMNLGRLSQTKTQTQIASMAGASQLGSSMASYGQYLFETQMGGRKRICAPSGVLMALILVVVVVILIIITIASYGAASPLWGALGAVIGVSAAVMATVTLALLLTMAIVSLILQIAVIQPAITKMWNKIIQDTMGISDQFSEQSILAGLSNIVTDNKQVPDLNDFDNDYYWGYDGDKPKDRINRFAYYYTEKRMKEIEKPELAKIERFMGQLRDFVYKTPEKWYVDPVESPEWGLYDPVNCKDNPDHKCCYDPMTDPTGALKFIPSYCNPCCVPPKIPNPLKDKNPATDDEFVNILPSCCDCYKADGTGCPQESQCGVSTFCATRSPFGEEYPFVYDRYNENDTNNFFRKRIQLDPKEEAAKIALDGKLLMPNPATTWRIKSFDTTNCVPESVPPNPPREPGDQLIQQSLNNLIILKPSWNFGSRECPRGFEKVNETVTAPNPIYAGKCDGVIRVSRVLVQDKSFQCAGIDPPEVPKSFVSFREALGFDDESRDFVKNPDDPNGAQFTVASLGDEKYRKFNLFDASGYYTEPEFLNSDFGGARVIDQKKGVYPFFYKIADWGLDLSQLEEPGNLTAHPEHCYWFDSRYASPDGTYPPECIETGPLYAQQPKGLTPALELPVDPTTLSVNTTNHVDGVNLVPGHMALRPDKVTTPSKLANPGTGEFIAADDYCAQEMRPLNPLAPLSEGFWKRGAERYCQPHDNPDKLWPYFAHCPKHKWTPPGEATCKEDTRDQDTDGDGDIDDNDINEETEIDCYCAYEHSSGDPLLPYNPLRNPGAIEFPEDMLDNIVYGMKDFLDVARVMFRQWEGRKVKFAVNFKYWYPDIAEWIEPIKSSGRPCFICDEEYEGELWTAYKAISEMRRRLEAWRDSSYLGEGDSNLESVWCLPSASSTTLVQSDERRAFTSAKGIQGVINCLTHNLTNDQRFKACYEGCENAEALANTAIPYDRANPSNFPGASAEGYNQVVRGQLCKPLPRSLINKPADPVTGTPETNFDPSGEFQNLPSLSSVQRLQRLLDCEFKTCIKGMKTCNSQRCEAENDCQDAFQPCVDACLPPPTDELACIGNCTNCIQYCKTGTPAIKPDGTPGDLAGCGVFPDRSCADIEQLVDKPVCDRITNFGWIGSCAWFCQRNWGTCTTACGGIVACENACLATYNNCFSATLPDGSFHPNSCEGKKITCYNNAATKRTTCEGRCETNYWTDCSDDCKDRTDYIDPDGNILLNVPCVQKCNNKRIDCYKEAERVWREECKTDDTYNLCGGNPRPYNCQTEIRVDIDELWTAKEPPNILPGCKYPDQRTDPEIGFSAPDEAKRLATANPVDINPLGPMDDPLTVDFMNGPEGVNEQKGACNKPEILALLRQSVPEAKNQAAKFKKRIEFLSNRLSEANENIAILREAEIEFKQFLEGAAVELIAERHRFETLETGLPYHIIYGWEGPPAESRALYNAGQGYWHVIKVETRTVGKCDNDCGAPGNGPKNTDPGWPRVKTYTKSSGTERCYALTNTNGMFKFRVTRFDEDRDPSVKNSEFPGGQKIWDFRMFHPLRGPIELNKMRTACRDAEIPTPADVPEADIFRGAFLLNKPKNNPDCWAEASEVLTHGASTQLCGVYYFHLGNPKGMSHQFIKCPPDRF